MRFPLEDNYWMEIRLFLERFANPLDAILAPHEFMEFFPGNYHYHVAYCLPVKQFEFVVIHKGMVEDIGLAFILDVLKELHPVFANPVFVVYARNQFLQLPEDMAIHLPALFENVRLLEAKNRELAQQDQDAIATFPPTAITVTTYNRPHCLKRSLPQFLALGVPVVVVDDASTPENYREN